MDKKHLFRVAKIVNTHGLKGDLKIIFTTDFPDDRFKIGNELIVVGKKDLKVKVKKFQHYKQGGLIAFEGYDNINDVEYLKKTEIFIENRNSDADLETEEYYHTDLLGCVCFDENGSEVGKVKSITETPAHDLLIIDWVAKGCSKEKAIPFTMEFTGEVDIANKKIVLKNALGILEQ